MNALAPSPVRIMLKIDVHRDEGLTIIQLAGKYDITEITNFERVFIGEIEKRPAVVALMLKDLKYIDSSGIGSLVRSFNLAEKYGVDFVCYNLNTNTERILSLSKIDLFMKILSEEAFINTYVKKKTDA